MPNPMAAKTPGKLHSPPSQADFDKIELGRLCKILPPRSYLRLHSQNPFTKRPWPAANFSRAGNSRFDPPAGPGTLYLGQTLAGVMMEIFDDKWACIGDLGRSISRKTLSQYYLSQISLPALSAFDACGGNLSKIGTDLQLLTAEYSVTQQWALRLANHPAGIEGILYPSRHNPSLQNLAVFKRPLILRSLKKSRPKKLDSLLPDILAACRDLEVAILP